MIGVTIITLGVRGLCLTTSLSRSARWGSETVKTDERHSVHKYTLYNFYRSSTRIIAEALTSLFALRSFAVIFYNVAESDSQSVENISGLWGPQLRTVLTSQLKKTELRERWVNHK